ncbi:Cys-tRNA(Pro) deacylase [Spelaeicoccus albus]|uniref:Cys-tRNA(Pro)/Cys-tRNA(Cys) deacylase n=1 Tax=Spelaeicoccus albus TaxID=1280376 RepID=A0A7Z0A9J5_9MICO|nr:Cys-tRNA(Pro) deacylase [Spelaeicoccus albus]NYI66060.1 Cys-tRNA(Pro)/Cys-tRNA(Cys) deacylase [Spelaeicoccus albus]
MNNNSSASKTHVGTPATRILEQIGVPYEIHAYTHDPAVRSFGAEASAKLGVEPHRVFKTLLIKVDDDLVVAILPVSSQLDLKALASAHGGKKAHLAGVAEAERRTGYVVGGMSPLGQRQTSPTVLDMSALDFQRILISGGRRGLDIELAPNDLVMLTNAHVARIARPD